MPSSTASRKACFLPSFLAFTIRWVMSRFSRFILVCSEEKAMVSRRKSDLVEGGRMVSSFALKKAEFSMLKHPDSYSFS